MQLYPFLAALPKMEFIRSASSFFSSVKEDYLEYVQTGFFNFATESSFYLYQIQKNNRLYTGLLACIDINDYFTGKVLRHEATLPNKEQRQTHLFLKHQAAIKPVLLTHPNVESLQRTLQELTTLSPTLVVQLGSDDELHTLWEIKDPAQVGEIQHLYKKNVDRVYIGDGHHRCSVMATLSKVRDNPNYQRIFAALFPSSELEIYEFNRVVEAFDSCSSTFLMARLSQICDIFPLAQASRPQQKHELTLFINQEWYTLQWKKEVLDQYAHQPIVLDTQILDEQILQNILSIDKGLHPRVQYIEGPKGIEGLRSAVLLNDQHIGFYLFPVQQEDFFHLADSNQVLPPKSTWFEPRMQTGLIVFPFNAP